MKKFVLSLFMLVAAFNVCAQSFTVDGINYTVASTSTVAVVSGGVYTGSITIPSNVTFNAVDYFVTTIGEHAFYNCTGLTSITLPSTLTSISDHAFYYCTGLTSITLPSSLTSIDFAAFSFCTGLTAIVLPNSLTSISTGGFYYCTGLTSITFPSGLTSIGNSVFGSCMGLKSITLPNSVTSIDDYGFGGCQGLTSITLPNSLTTIGYGAINTCFRLTSITLPSSLTSIGGHAFDDCTGLTELKANSINPPTTGSYAFYNINKSIPLYVPCQSVDLYKNASGWNEFMNIVSENNLIIAAISAPVTLCAGSSLPTEPTVTPAEATITAQGWQMETTVGGGTFANLSDTYNVVVADNGKKIRYFASNSCGTVYSNEVEITVVTIDASQSNTPAQVGTSANLIATLSSAVSGIAVNFTLDDGNGHTFSYIATTLAGTATTTTANNLPVGVYKVTASISNCITSGAAYLAIYDPTDGFVTGGGWITSPLGAYVANKALTGKANFGFNSKYEKGKNIPTGNTEFQFQTGSLNFSSSSYSVGSLVIAGKKAIYKGEGTINSLSGYSFMVSAVDGDLSGGDGYDKFRIKIWNTIGDTIVYDNCMGLDENYMPTTALGGGSIVIHSADNKLKAANYVQENPFTETSFNAYPNPFLAQLNFSLQTPDDTHARLEVFDLTGRRVAVVFDMDIKANELYTIDYKPATSISIGVLSYRLTLNEKVLNGKVIYNRK